MPDPARQLAATLANPLMLNGGRPPTLVTGNYSMRKDDGWIVVVPALGAGQIQIQLPADPDPGSVYFVTRVLGSVEPSTVDVVVVGNLQQSATGYDTLYSIGANNGGYHISRLNETVGFAVGSQQPNFVPHPYTDWFVFGGLGLEFYSAAFVPNLAGTVTVPLAGFAPGNGAGDGGHPRSLYGLSIAVTPVLTAGNLRLSPRFNGVTLSADVLDLSSATQPAASRVTAQSPIAGPGVGFFTSPPGCFLFSPPAAGGILDVQITGSGGAAGPTAGVVTALVF
jgi:hypothetical protein